MRGINTGNVWLSVDYNQSGNGKWAGLGRGTDVGKQVPFWLSRAVILFIHNYHHHNHLIPNNTLKTLTPYTRLSLTYTTRHLPTEIKINNTPRPDLPTTT